MEAFWFLGLGLTGFKVQAIFSMEMLYHVFFMEVLEVSWKEFAGRSMYIYTHTLSRTLSRVQKLRI